MIHTAHSRKVRCGMYRYRPILDSLVREVDADLVHQVMDRADPAYGGFVSAGYGMAVADHTSGGLSVARAACALLAEQSPMKGDPELLTRVIAGLRFVRRWQRPTGLIDLPRVDFDSPPDTAFVVQLLCPVLMLARRLAADGDSAARTLVDELVETLHPMASGIVGRGFRTPNHRWVVCSALAQAKAALDGFEADDYIRSILAETIDINPDGEFSERSTGVYNAVCDRSLRYIADLLPRQNLLDHVRANLSFMELVMEPDGTVLTCISRRQDQGRTYSPISMADSFFDMAIRDDNMSWLAIADRLADIAIRNANAAVQRDHSVFWLLQPFLRTPDWIHRRPVSGSCHTEPRQALLRHSKMWISSCKDHRAIAMGGNATAFSLRNGDAVLQALRVSGTYFHAAHFSADSILPIESSVDGDGVNGVTLKHDGSLRHSAAWDLPLNRPVVFDNPHKGYYELADAGTRERWKLPPLDIELKVQQVDSGYDLLLSTDGGLDRIPFVVELFFPSGGRLQTRDLDCCPAEGSELFLRHGVATYRMGRHAISVGPGREAHRVPHTHAAGKVAGCFRVVINLLTPLNNRIEIRYGLWSEATRAIHAAPKSAPVETRVKEIPSLLRV